MTLVQRLRLAATNSSPGDRGFALAITLLAVALRLLVVVRFSGEPVWDGHYYHFGAVRLADGLGYSEDVLRNGLWIWKPWTHYPVGYSLWLSLWYRVLGSHLWVAPLSNACVGAATVWLVHRLAIAHLGVWRARLAALITTLHPGLVLYTAVVMSEPLAAALVLGSLWALTSSSRRWLGLCCSGVVLGASVLVRPSSLVALPLYWLMLEGGPKARLRSLAILTVLCFATILPWTLRNCRRMDGCVLVSTNTGWNLAIGALTDTGRFRPLRARDGCPVVTGQVQQDRCWLQRGLSEIRRDPVHFLRIMPQKLAQTFDHESFAVEYLREANPGAWPEPKRVFWRERLTDAHRWLMATATLSVVSVMIRRDALRRREFYVQLAVLGALVALLRSVFVHVEHPFYWLVIALVGLALLPLPGRPTVGGLVGFSVGLLGFTALTHAVFFGDDRYHLVVSPFLCILAAAALRVRQSPSSLPTLAEAQATGRSPRR